jgi:hypothetical protein
MGVFEYSPEERRLHFHALVYIPPGQFLGKTEKVRRFSHKKKRNIDCYENDFFRKAFGLNDFAPMYGVDISFKNLVNPTVKYILKYMLKDQEKIVYSRAIPTFMYKEISAAEMAAPVVREVSDFILQYVLFEDVISDEEPREKLPVVRGTPETEYYYDVFDTAEEICDRILNS